METTIFTHQTDTNDVDGLRNQNCDEIGELTALLAHVSNIEQAIPFLEGKDHVFVNDLVLSHMGKTADDRCAQGEMFAPCTNIDIDGRRLVFPGDPLTHLSLQVLPCQKPLRHVAVSNTNATEGISDVTFNHEIHEGIEAMKFKTEQCENIARHCPCDQTWVSHALDQFSG